VIRTPNLLIRQKKTLRGDAFMIWAASNITQGSLELYAHLYYLFTLQIFFVAIRKGDILHLPARAC
jgi:hypothetical protein